MSLPRQSNARRPSIRAGKACGGPATVHSRGCHVGVLRWLPIGPRCAASRLPTTPSAFERPPQPAPRCFPSASPALTRWAGKQKTAPKDRFNALISLKKSGAGEGIRTLDPNLGKVVLYP